MERNNLNEELNRFNNLFKYNPSKGISEAKIRRPAPGYLNEEEPEDEEEEFDFEDEEGAEGEEENTDFDFGDEGSPEEEVEDEFGTADEFSAAGDLEDATSDDEVEEIDVTDIVKGADEAKEMSKQAVTIGQENSSYLKSLTDKLSNLESQLSKMDTISTKISKLEQDVKTPEEKLELRSLDSYPFNQKLSDYWEEKAATDDRYKISTGKNNEDGHEREYVLSKDDVEDYSNDDIKKSFVPEQRTKKYRI